VPEAEVKAVQTATGAVRTVRSGADGTYLLANLPVGPYQLEVSKEGFTRFVQTGIILQVASNPAIDPVLKVGSVSEQLSVEANAALVETHSTGIGQVVDQQRVVDLPLNGRQATELVFLAGAATQGVNSDTQTSGKNYPIQTISVAGGRTDGITSLLDGGLHNDTSNSMTLPLPFPDALQEFKVETSALPAQYGQHSGAALNAVSRSGSNALHGNLFEFLRNSSVNARNAFAPVQDGLKRNQFGGTIGGPIQKNKLFYFVGYQGTIQRQTPVNNIVIIPTPAMVQGDFTAYASAACQNGSAKTLRNGFLNGGIDAQGNTIWKVDPARISVAGLNLMKLYPVTNDPCGRYAFGAPNNVDEHQTLIRGDYQLNEKHSLLARYYVTHLFIDTADAKANVLNSSVTGTEAQDQSLILGDTYIINPTTVSSFRATGIRTAVSKVTPSAFTGTDLGVNMYSLPGADQRLTQITITGGPTLGSVINKGFFPSVTWQLAEDMSLIRGAHQIGFGGSFIRGMMNVYSTRFANGGFTFNGQTTGVNYGDVLTGALFNFQQGSPSVFQPRGKYVGVYGQDSWKLSSRITVSYGLRWEPLIANSTAGGRLSIFRRDWFDAGVKSARFPNGPPGTLFPGDTMPGGGKVPDGISSTNWKNFAPRFGIVVDPRGNGRMTIRAAYGIFYDLPNFFWNNNVGYEAPWSGLVQLSGVSFDNPYQNYAGGNPFPYIFTNSVNFNNAGQYWNGTSTRKPMYMQQWNLSIQKQFGDNWIVSANYLGNEVVHQWGTVDINPAVYSPGATTATTQARRVLTLASPAKGQYYSQINTLYDGGTQSYNGLLLSIQRRFNKGLTVQGNYTLSHCIGTGQNYELTSPSITILNNAAYDRGNCITVDRRHILNVSMVAETPRFSNRTTRMLASGWKFSTNISAQSGTWLSVGTGVDSAFSGQTTSQTTASQRPDLVLSSQYPAHQSVKQWINPLAFALPAPGTYGNLGSATVLGPGALNINMALVRAFSVREKQRLEARVEMFNAINTVNLAAPNLMQSTSTFGQITSTATSSGLGGSPGDPRIFQVAMKYVF
jgi:hypothetical protein